MKDRNGVEITVGARATILVDSISGYGFFNGKVGTVRAVRLESQTLRVSDGPENQLLWSLWCRPSDVAVVVAAAAGSPAGAAPGREGT